MSEFEKVMKEAAREAAEEEEIAERAVLDDIAEGKSGRKGYGEKMNEKRAQCYAMIEDACLDAVAGTENLKKFLAVQSRFEKYSLNNNLLIYAQKPAAVRFRDFNAWVEDGVSVEGAKSFVILEPHKYTAADGSIRRGYNPKKVFDIADVDVPESEYPKAQSYEQKRLLEALVHDSPVPIRRTEKALGDGLAVYDPEQKAVFFKSGMGFDQIFPALAQALSHAQMAMEAERYQVREHEFAARCSAYVISLKYGADTKAADIHTIPQRFETMDAEDIKKELLEIHDSVKAITERMAEVLEKTQYKEPPQSKNRRTREVRE